MKCIGARQPALPSWTWRTLPMGLLPGLTGLGHMKVSGRARSGIRQPEQHSQTWAKRLAMLREGGLGAYG